MFRCQGPLTQEIAHRANRDPAQVDKYLHDHQRKPN